MTTDAEKSFKAKLRAIAKEKKRDPADLWQNLTLERFLVRLSHSKYSRHFVLKGGVLLSKYIEIGRETTDLDFLAQKINNETPKIKAIFEEIAEMDLLDGFTFKDVSAFPLPHPHMNYPGITVSMISYFGKTRFKVSIDIGFGDIVTPITYEIPLTTSSKGDLFEHSINLSCYPKEFILAEKLETVVYRGAVNSRMKDFQDLYSLITSPLAKTFSKLEPIVCLVFQHRNTPLQLPLSFSREELSQLQKLWSLHLKTLHSQSKTLPPKEIEKVISAINSWIASHTNLPT